MTANEQRAWKYLRMWIERPYDGWLYEQAVKWASR